MRLDGFTDVSGSLRSGVYALCAKGVVIYVGKSRAMISRINSHRSAWSDKRKGKTSWIVERLGIPGLLFDEIHVRPCRLDQLDALEEQMINLYKPRYNVQLKTSQKVRSPVTLQIGAHVIAFNSPVAEPIARRL